jgi:hypothetical protein
MRVFQLLMIPAIIKEILYNMCYTGLTDKKIIHGRKIKNRSGPGQACLPREIIGMPDNPPKR